MNAILHTYNNGPISTVQTGNSQQYNQATINEIRKTCAKNQWIKLHLEMKIFFLNIKDIHLIFSV